MTFIRFIMTLFFSSLDCYIGKSQTDTLQPFVIGNRIGITTEEEEGYLEKNSFIRNPAISHSW